jgi:hypothetical protein
MSVGDPCGKRFDLAKFADGCDAAEIESGLAGQLLDAGWKISGQWLVISGQ